MIGPSPGLVEHQKRWHTATCTVTRRPGSGDPVFDPNTGTYTDPPPDLVYAGDCLFIPSGGDRVQEFGEGPVVTRVHTVEIAVLTVAFKVGDTVTIDTAQDPQAVGIELIVLDVPKSELATVRRLVAEEVL